MKYRHDVRVRHANYWELLWIPVIFVTVLGFLYAADYVDTIDVPFFDRQHDLAEKNGS